MPIKRAGPFASSTNSFLDKPNVLDLTIFPVNCSLYNSSFWSWRAIVQRIVFETSTIEIKTPNSNGVLEEINNAGENNTAAINFGFAYQSSEDLRIGDITEPRNLFAFAIAEGDSASVKVLLNGTTIEEDSGTLAIVALNDITLPKSIVPSIFIIEVTAESQSTTEAIANVTFGVAMQN